MERLDVSILGREYTLACASGEKDTLVAAAQHADRIMQKLRTQSKAGTSTERIAIMACLQLAAELLATPLDAGQAGQVALGDYKRRIEDIENLIDSVLPRQHADTGTQT